jgi:hypothetical protein
MKKPIKISSARAATTAARPAQSGQTRIVWLYHHGLKPMRRRSKVFSMFDLPVVFVVGAGASKEYGFPLGGELKSSIAEAVGFLFNHGIQIRGNHDLYNHISRHVPDQARRSDYTRAANALVAAIPTFVSIDEALHFVSSSKEAVEVGKIAIITKILEAERESALGFNLETGRVKIDPNEGQWLGQFLSLALAELRRDQLKTAFDNVTFINFNYDRCIEHFLYWSLQHRAGASPEGAEAIVRSLHMIRPYGSIGELSFTDNDANSFGTRAHFNPFDRLNALRTYTEQHPLHDDEQVQKALAEARKIIFLGFGFHRANLDLLKTGDQSIVPTGRRVLGTIMGLHRENHPVIRRRLVSNLRIGNEEISLLEDMTASQLLGHLRHSILMD